MKNRKYILIKNENTKRFLALATHIKVMAEDAYLTDHPEWHELVKEANQMFII